MAKPKPLKFCLKCELYHVPFGFWFGDFDEAAIISYAKRTGLETKDTYVAEAEGRIGCVYNFERGPLLWMPKRPEKAGDYADLMHELYHAAMHCGRIVHMNANEETEEFYAYLIQWLSHNLFKRLW